ncbi:MAG: glycosyltransferase family 2 protein [Lachnospiraceae bacterium]|nr:glycosyltransferase family 2 protein [Lachnospiraceae bacterium]
MNPMLSVIMPVYNGEKYIEHMVSALLKQTYEDFELIIVDDGSSDGTRSICEKHSRDDSRIKFLFSEHGGVVKARNYAVNASKGEYVCFVDVDDDVDDDYLMLFVDCINEHSPDMVITGYAEKYLSWEIEKVNKVPEGIYSGQELIDIYPHIMQGSGVCELGINPFLWTKCIKREVVLPIMNATNECIVEGEDAAIVFPCLLHSKKIVISKECRYHYIYRGESVTHTRKFDYYKNCLILYEDIGNKMRATPYYNLMRPQLEWYLRLMIYISDPNAFDMYTRVFPFGKVVKGANIILYGAGNLGKLYQHQFCSQNYGNIVLWVDGAWERYIGDGRNIKSPEEIMSTNYDYIVIAVFDHRMVEAVISFLKSKNISESKIVY